MGAAPHPMQHHFCCVRVLFDYFSMFPGRRGALALASHGVAVKWTDLRELCRMVAVANGLDPLRLLPHSLRSGAQSQLEMASDERRTQQGGWLTAGGMRIYARKMLGHAKEVAAALHDPSICLIAHTVILFNEQEGHVGGV